MWRFGDQRLWPQAVLILRIPRVITKGHPFQVSVETSESSGIFRIAVSLEISEFLPLGASSMHTSNRSKTLTESVTAKVTPEEKERFADSQNTPISAAANGADVS